jgi:hypothetical protein
MEKASAVFMDEAMAELRLFHREFGYAGALGAARRVPAGKGDETTSAMPALWQYLSPSIGVR